MHFRFLFLYLGRGSDDKKASHRTGREATGGRGPVESDLLNRTSNRGEDVIRIGTDEPDRTNYNHQNHRQHDCVFSDVLSVIVRPQLGEGGKA